MLSSSHCVLTQILSMKLERCFLDEKKNVQSPYMKE